MNRPARRGLAGSVVVITGAASGIGAAAAAELHRRGAHPVLIDCDADRLARTASAIAPDVLTQVADVSSLAQCEAALQGALARYGRLDVVWANAGIAAFGPVHLTDPAAWRRCIEVNLLGSFNTARVAMPALMTSRGYLLISASVSSFAHPPMMSAYAASKAGVEAMANAWRIELAAHGVDVGVIHASWVRTPLIDEGELHPGFRRLRQTVPRPMRHAMSPEQAARHIVAGLERRASRIWVPGWVRMLHWLRACLHWAPAERELRRAAPELEQLYLEGLQAEGALASSFGPRERARSRRRLADTEAERR